MHSSPVQSTCKGTSNSTALLRSFFHSLTQTVTHTLSHSHTNSHTNCISLVPLQGAEKDQKQEQQQTSDRKRGSVWVMSFPDK